MKTLRPYQERGQTEIALHWRSGKRRGLMVSPTASGKSVVAVSMAHKAVKNDRRVLIIADRCLLISQMAEHAASFNIPFGMIMAGYDTKPAAPLQIASKDTFLARVLRKQSVDLPEADFVIFDEAHRSVTKSAQALLAAYPQAYIVGLTATPTRPDGKGLGGEGGYEFMVELEKPSKLLEQGYILPAKCFAPEMPDLANVPLNKDGDYQQKALAKTMNRTSMVGDVPTWWKKLADGRPTLTYGCDISHSVALVAEYQAAGIKAAHVDGKMPKQQILDLLDEFKDGKWNVLASCDLLTEGIDLPFVGAMQLVRPTKSLRLFLQMVGRPMRPFDGTLNGEKLSWPAKDHFILIDHAGCVLLHGTPGTDIEWELSPEAGTVEDRQQRRRDSGDLKPPCCCPDCKCIHDAAPLCPNCGHEYKSKRKPKHQPNRPGTLVHVAGGAGNLYDGKLLDQEWHKALAVARKRGLTFGAAAAIFKRTTGLLPWQAGITDKLPPDRNWKAYVAHVYPTATSKATV